MTDQPSRIRGSYHVTQTANGPAAFRAWSWPLDEGSLDTSQMEFPLNLVAAGEGLVRVRLWIEDGQLRLRIGRWDDNPPAPKEISDG